MAVLRTLGVFVAVALVLVVPCHGGRGEPPGRASLAGDLLVASPTMADPRFSGTVIYMIAHDAEGAMGLVINRSLGEGSLAAVLGSFGIEIRAPDRRVRLHYGGPVEPGRGFVLHSADYLGASTRPVGDGVAVSMGRDVLEAVAAGHGPSRHLFIFGYAGWAPGQLEQELTRDDWLTAPADTSLIFTDDLETMWQRAMESAGLAL